MILRYLLLTLSLAGVALSGLGAQRFVPLAEVEEMQRPRKAEAPRAKMACGEFGLEDVEQITVGTARSVRIDLDTAGLGSDLTDYRCTGCDATRFGTVTLRNDTLSYTPRADVVQGLDTVFVQVCSPSNVCSEPRRFVFLAQRAGRTVDLGNLPLAPSANATLTFPAGDLPGGASCRNLELCADDYPGRERRASFRLGFGESNDVLYTAARYAGTDAVCVTLCNAFGLCDTYRATVTVSRTPVELPFFDDFSYTGVRPDAGLWQDEDVLVNRNYGILPPSIGVATFDATDFDGQPYQAQGNSSVTLPRDYLTSTPINLAGQAGTVLSFFLQPKGLGNRPERQDSFLVQFLTASGEWQTVFARGGLLTTVSNTRVFPFEGVLVPVPPAYQYSGFQFRFLNKSSERGAVDNWNLDYVKLSNRSTSLITQDLALVEPPFRLIEPYTSMPVRHLQAGGSGLLTDSIFLVLDNHRSDVTPVSSSNYEVTIPGQSGFRSGAGLLPSVIFGSDNDIAPDTLEIRRSTFDAAPNYGDIANFLLNVIDPALDYLFATIYRLSIDVEDAGFAPGITTNNTATRLTELADYLAYDDGSAEVALEGQTGNVIVQRYRAYVPDQLTGIRIRIPRGLGSLGNQDIRFNVYGAGTDSLPGELLYSFDQPVLFAEDAFRDSLQAFTSYALPEPLDLPVGDFFVGWEQLRADRSIPVGYDRNNRPEGVQFFDAGSGWRALRGSTAGAIMLRPLLSGADIDPTATRDPVRFEQFVDVFPNPTAGALQLRPRADVGQFSYRLIAPSGATVAQGANRSSIDLGALPRGLYLLECRSGKRVSRHKIIRQ